ncbi:MAG: NUDIX domain-containing protein [Planctomycetes bacterium]|nr:NUDIX domain-containing protein [Planctomycetota bacterium]
MNPSEEPILAAGVLIMRNDGASDRILLLRNRTRGDWGFPKGHSDPGEDDYATARRELAEETGIVEFELEPDFRFVSTYVLPAGRNRGRRKRVTYYLARVKTDILQLSREHDQAVWATRAEVEQRLPYGELANIAREAFLFVEAKRNN